MADNTIEQMIDYVEATGNEFVVHKDKVPVAVVISWEEWLNLKELREEE